VLIVPIIAGALAWLALVAVILGTCIMAARADRLEDQDA
jgi:hypothetical protein